MENSFKKQLKWKRLWIRRKVRKTFVDDVRGRVGRSTRNMSNPGTNRNMKRVTTKRVKTKRVTKTGHMKEIRGLKLTKTT